MKDFYKKESPILTLPSLAGGFQGGAGESDPWAHVIGNANSDDYPGQIVLDSSRNIIITIVQLSKLVVMKLKNDGTILWGRKLDTGTSYGTGLDKADVAVDSSNNIYAAVTTDSGYTPVASSVQNAGNIVLVKYNSSGVIQWQREIATSYSSGSGNLGGIACDSSDNVYVTGTQIGYNQSTSAYQKYVLVKFNSSGTHQWTERLQGYYNTSVMTGSNRSSMSQYHRSMGITHVPAASGQPEGVCICGRQQNVDSQSSSADFFVARYDTSGNIQWRNCYGRSVYGTYNKGEGPSYGYDVKAMKPITTDGSGNILVVGTATNNQQFNSGYPKSQMLFKLDPSGSITWNTTFGWFDDRGQSLAVTNSGDIVAVGGRYASHSYYYPNLSCMNFYTSSGTPKRAFFLDSGGSGTYSDYDRVNYASSVAADNKDFFYLLAAYKSVTTSSTSNTALQIVVFKLSTDFTSTEALGSPELAGWNGTYAVQPNRWGIRDRGPSSTFVANPSYQYINSTSAGLQVFDQSTGGYPSGARMTDSITGAGTLPINTTSLTDSAATYIISQSLVSNWPPASQ